jgi:hypothetical protein
VNDRGVIARGRNCRVEGGQQLLHHSQLLARFVVPLEEGRVLSCPFFHGMSHIREVAASATVIEPEVSVYPAILACVRSSSSFEIGVDWMRLCDVLRSTVAEGTSVSGRKLRTPNA